MGLQYTGDRLNFGMACEKANMEGINCKMVVAADDCALERTKGITGARGVAGTVFLHKVAGAAAAQGKSLDEVADLANAVSARMGTVGVAMDSVTVPGAESTNDRLDEKTIGK
jgi:triose/dihydroxyacetone kinase / FAD-AMP lyase (cyclizing)